MSSTDREHRPHHAQATAVRRNPWVMGAAALPFLLCLFGIIGGLTINPGAFQFTLLGFIFGAVTTFAAWGRNPWPRLKPTDVRVDDEWLTIGDRSYPRAEIKSGLVLPADGHVTVRLARRGLRPPIEVRVPDEEQGRALLRALGLAATQTVADFRTMSRVHTSLGRSTAASLGTLVAGGLLTAAFGTLIGPWAAMAAMMFGLLTLFVLLLAPTRFQVGADGVLLRWLGRERFISHGDIERTRTTTLGWGRDKRKAVVLTLASGEEVVIPTGPSAFDFGQTRGIEARIRAAKQAWAGDESVHAEALLRRGERSYVEWIGALQNPQARASHRSAPVPKQRLWRIVEDPKVESLDRAAAAVALKPELDAEDRARLQRTAATIAAPRLRIALDAVAHDADEHALAEALAELEVEQDERKAG